MKRKIELLTQPAISDWNATFLDIEVVLVVPNLLLEPQTRNILMELPYDWYFIELINSSATIATINQTTLLSGRILGLEYLFSLQELISYYHLY